MTGEGLRVTREGFRAVPSKGLALLLLFAAAAARAQNLPAVPRATIINLTSHAGFFNEPSIAVNPRNPQNLVAAYQVAAHAAYSFDGGRTWKTASHTAARRYRVSGDVSVTFDNRGHAFLCYIAFDRLGSEDYWAHDATRNGIFVRRSLDGGKTWEATARTVVAHPTVPGIPFEDKPYIVADDTRGPFAGNLYIGWTHFTLTDSEIYFSRSTDGGETWSAPIRISARQGLPRDDNGSLEGFSGAVGPDGTLYVVWSDGQHIVFTLSRDGGKTFELPRNVVPTAPDYFKVYDVSRANGFPQIGLDADSGEHGRLFVTWSDYRNGDVDVFCSTSRDGGSTWSPAVRVNNDPIHNGSDQFFQWLAVDPVTGAVNVLFYDRRGDPQNLKTIVVLARSTDDGKTFANYAWTMRPFDAKDDFIGDYTGLAAYGSRVYGIWTEEGSVPNVSRSARHATGPPRISTPSRGHHTTVRVGIADFSK